MERQLKLWICVYRRSGGFETWPVWKETRPWASDEVAKIDGFDREAGEALEIRGPFDIPEESGDANS